MTEQRDRVEINWVQVSASALAAVSSAVLLSTVGVAGTIIGALIGSLFATAGSAIYSHYLRVTRERVAHAQALALEKVTRARAGASGVWADTRQAEARGQRTQAVREQRKAVRAEADLEDAERDFDQAASEKTPWREVLTGLPWKWIAAVTGAVFVIAMLVILTFELVTGHAVSSYTGGSDGARTSIPGLGSRAATTRTPTPEPTQEPSSGPTSSEQPSPSSSPSGSTTPSPSPTSSPTGAPATQAPTTTPTPTPTLTPTPTPAQTPVG